jgi:hypothetical protein
VNGKIYVIGGFSAAFTQGLSTVEEYDPITDHWETKAPMPTGRLALATCVMDGKIYAIGGAKGVWSDVQQTVEMYDPQTDTWTAKADMPTGRFMLVTDVVDGKIYAIGGALVNKTFISTVEAYDPITDTWNTQKTDMPTPRGLLSACVLDGLIYAIGGGTTSAGFAEVEAYDPATDTWDTTKTDLPESRAFLSPCASVVDGKVYIIGGSKSGAGGHPGLNTVFEYDPYGTSSNVEESFEGQNNPKGFMLQQNYPNPFNPTTNIEYFLEQGSEVEIKIFDILGNHILTLVNEFRNSGKHKEIFHANYLSSGVYFYTININGMQKTKSMVLLR